MTGPDLAQLLIEDSRIEDDLRFMGTKSPLVAQPSTGSMNEEASDLLECTNFLLRGCVDVSHVELKVFLLIINFRRL